MGHYASFHEKPSPPPITIHAGPVHAGGALSANMVSVIEDYYLPEIEDMTFSAPAIPKKGVQKVTGKKSRIRVNVPRLQRAVDQSLLDDDDDGKLTPIEDMDELEDAPMPNQAPHVVPPATQILKQTPSIQPSSNNPPITRTTKTGKVQELVQSQGLKDWSNQENGGPSKIWYEENIWSASGNYFGRVSRSIRYYHQGVSL